MSAASREDLERLHALLLDALLGEFAREDARISAAMMMVTRRFLKDCGVSVDASSALDLRKSLEQLQGLALPFTHTKKETKK